MSRRPAIAVLNYGMGNLRSVSKALEATGAEVGLVSDPVGLDRFDGCVLPGVGAFPRAMDRISERGLDAAIESFAETGKPVLGICLGLQLLFESSDELGGATGLGLMPGPVVTLDSAGMKLPHIGWAEVHWQLESPLVSGIDSAETFYFVHSHVAEPLPGDTVGTSRYGTEFACVVARENVFGVQFHPEKSSHAGLALISNFVSLTRGEGP